MGSYSVTVDKSMKEKIEKFKGVFHFKSIDLTLQELIKRGYEASKKEMKEKI